MAISNIVQGSLLAVLVLCTFIVILVYLGKYSSAKDQVQHNSNFISEITAIGILIMFLAFIVFLSGGGVAPSTVVAPTTPTTSTMFSFIPKNIDSATSIMSILLAIGILTAFICTSLDLTTYDAQTKQNLFMAEGIIFTIVIIGLGFTASTVFGDNIQSKDIYIMMVLHAAVALSVVSLSASIMSKLSVANTIGNKPVAPQSA